MKKQTKKRDYLLINDKMQNMFDYIEKESVEAIITDPPYELGFMGKSWDSSGVAFQVDTWQKCYDALKPGGYLLAFGGSRTYHRICCAIEDAGFEIRDCIMWLYGSGFPKSMALDKALEGKLTTGNANKTQFHKLNGKQEEKHHYGFTTKNKEMGFRPKDYTTEGKSTSYLKELEATTDLAKKYKGWGTCLKPAYEPIIVARKPFKGSLVDNVIENGVGGLNIDGCRIPLNGEAIAKNVAFKEEKQSDGWGTKKCITELDDQTGRFPANVILTYDDTDFDEVCSGFPETKSQKRDSRYNKATEYTNTYTPVKSDYRDDNTYNDEGSASRYFYCAKASKKDRDEGLDLFDSLKVNDGRQTAIDNPFQRGESLRKNIHPTVKPVELMQYLIRLVAPKGSTVMDCFMGSGSTGKAVMFENRERNAGYKFIGIEMTDEYLPICEARIEYALNKYKYDEEKELQEDKENGLLNIFDFM